MATDYSPPNEENLPDLVWTITAVGQITVMDLYQFVDVQSLFYNRIIHDKAKYTVMLKNHGGSISAPNNCTKMNP